jgi:TetR/AcrR family tetracycline transcriptional repressor
VRHELSPLVIRAAAMELIDERGYAALSMRNLASRLGVQAASLYHHLPNRVALLRLIADEIATTAVGTPAADTPWRDLLTDLARSLRRTLAAHPGATVIVATQDVSPEVWQPLVPPILRSMRAELDLDDATAMFVAQSLVVLVVGLALAEFGDVPEPPVAPPEFYDAWFEVAVTTFLSGIAAQYSPGG